MKKINPIVVLDIVKLRAGEFMQLIPEIYELKDAVENNPWHHYESVFDHTLSVLENLKVLLEKTSQKINSYLDQKVEKHTRRQLLFLGTLFHDIGKKEALVKNGESSTCPNHEEIGFVKSEKILDGFDLPKTEKEFVARIVKNHGAIHNILDLKNNNLKQDYGDFKNKFSDMSLELILLGFADTSGSYLKKTNPEEFKFRISFFENVLKKY